MSDTRASDRPYADKSEKEARSAKRRDDRGRRAPSPLHIPLRGWLDVLWRVGSEVSKDRVTMLAASVAFYATLALFPALVAVVSLYGLLANPHQIASSVARLSAAVPATARQLIIHELQRIASTPETGLTLSLIGSILVSLFSASSGVLGLIDGVTNAYDERETRGILRQRLLALGFALGAALFLVVSVAVLAVIPGLMRHFGLAAETRWLFSVLRWPALAACVMVALAILYRYAPNRTPARWPWVAAGAALATLIWLGASYLLSLYVESFSRFSHTYGALGAIIVLLLWFYVSGIAVLLGAEINAELERQTSVDTTIGPPRPMGQRGAVVADMLGKVLTDTPEAPLGERVRETAKDLVRPRREKSALDDDDDDDDDDSS